MYWWRIVFVSWIINLRNIDQVYEWYFFTKLRSVHRLLASWNPSPSNPSLLLKFILFLVLSCLASPLHYPPLSLSNSLLSYPSIHPFSSNCSLPLPHSIPTHPDFSKRLVTVFIILLQICKLWSNSLGLYFRNKILPFISYKITLL